MSVRDGKPPGEARAAYFSDRCGRAVEVGRDTWEMCGLIVGHQGECEPAPPTRQTVFAPESGQPPGEALCDSWHAVAYDECSLPSSHDGPCKYDRLAAVFAPETVQPPSEACECGHPRSFHLRERLSCFGIEGDCSCVEFVAAVSAPESGRAHADVIREALYRWEPTFTSFGRTEALAALDALLADLAASEQARDEEYYWKNEAMEREALAVQAIREAHEFIQRARPMLGMSVAGSLGAQADSILDALAAVGGAHQPGGEQT